MFVRRSGRLSVPEVFNAYASYYDLLYKDKDYAAEGRYIDGVIRKYKPGAKTVLNIGCGTGKHDSFLEKLNYQISGVDCSDTMLIEARKRAILGKLEFFKGDARDFDLGKKFDVVISLFHVMSYQVTDNDILAVFRTAEKHLEQGGVFIFDFWHGAGVLNDPPVLRVKRLEDEMVRVVRIAEPVMHKDRNVVDVNYQIFVLAKQSGGYSELQETHSMRYFFLPEIKDFLAKTGFLLTDAYSWMSNKPLGLQWYGLVIANKKGGM
ncbi:MAG: class I SAM-dependent methyltransferase [Candidatus Omnitrophica bacterium]|nr:class I SAM-dependent methyltransferase [Candidatus Omnitrophota bacterium]